LFLCSLLCCYKVKHNDNRDEESELENFITPGLPKLVLPPKGLNLSQKGGTPLRFLDVIQDKEESEEGITCEKYRILFPSQEVANRNRHGLDLVKHSDREGFEGDVGGNIAVCEGVRAQRIM
jgi:hypothetical protein